MYKSNSPHHYRIYPLKEIAYFRAPFPSPSYLSPRAPPFAPTALVPPTFLPSVVSSSAQSILFGHLLHPPLRSLTVHYLYDSPTSLTRKLKFPTVQHGSRSADLTVQANPESDALASRLRRPPSIRSSRSHLMHISTPVHTVECITCSLFPVCKKQTTGIDQLETPTNKRPVGEEG